MKSRAENAVKSYLAGFKQWYVWTTKYDEVQSLPAKPFYVAIYFASLIQDLVATTQK